MVRGGDTPATLEKERGKSVMQNMYVYMYVCMYVCIHKVYIYVCPCMSQHNYSVKYLDIFYIISAEIQHYFYFKKFFLYD